MGRLIVHERPTLRSPILVAAFSGWPDAAETATRAVQALRDQLQPRRLAEVPGDELYNLVSLRPTTAIRGGQLLSLRFPAVELFHWRNPAEERDAVFMLGPEPHLRWRAFVREVLDLALDRGVTAVYILGGLFDNVPHTRPVRLSCVVEDRSLRRRLLEAGLVPTDYEGPSSIHSVLLKECRVRGVPAASIWGHAPGYAQVSWNPMVTSSLLKTIGPLLGLPLSLTELEDASSFLRDALDRLIDRSPQARDLIEDLERSYGLGETQRPAEPPRISETIVREVEEILRRREPESGDDEPGQGDAPTGR